MGPTFAISCAGHQLSSAAVAPPFTQPRRSGLGGLGHCLLLCYGSTLFSCSSTPNHVVLINFNIWRTSLSSFLILSKKSPWSSVDFSNHVLLGFSLVFQIFLGFSSASSGRPSPGTNDTAFLPHSTHSYFRVLNTSGVWPPGRSGVFFLSCIQCWLTLFPL